MRSVGLALLLLHLPRLVLAQDAESANLEEEEARARFTAGEIAYAAGRFDDALADFQRAYELSERPELLYNVGLAADRLRHDEVAIDAFERFLSALPDHARADTVRERLELLRAQANEAQVEAAERERPSTPVGQAPGRLELAAPRLWRAARCFWPSRSAIRARSRTFKRTGLGRRSRTR